MVSQCAEIRCCRSCGSCELKFVVGLGEQFVSTFSEIASTDSLRVPLELVFCDRRAGGCGLVQLKHTVPPDLLYHQYWYRSGINRTMMRALADITEQIESRVSLGPQDLVLDIGCNDGTLLRSYSKPSLLKVGFEPSGNLLSLAKHGTSKIINDFFNLSSFQKDFPGKKAKVITTIAMFYDLENPNRFVSELAQILERGGLWVIQMNYLPLMLMRNAFDNICHEHLEYYSLSSLQTLLERHGLEVFDAELNNVNGGSFRIYAGHRGTIASKMSDKAGQHLQALRKMEQGLQLEEMETYRQFVSRIAVLKNKLLDFVRQERGFGKKIYVYGASTKGNTLLQFYGLDDTLIGKAVDKNTEKWGKKTVGTHIPIISEEQARFEKPDYFLILPWHFLDEFKGREKTYLQAGGKFIVPLPEFQIITDRDL
ncbi:MAG: class I SAM-dependent methyltransferase [Deltaproteobacteria bacterium]|nr:class I SAM-dependent methyltransferase [Deltaproteobacteria bacterium]